MCGGFIGEKIGLKKPMPTYQATPGADNSAALAAQAMGSAQEATARMLRRRQNSLLLTGGAGDGADAGAAPQKAKALLGA